jgi:dephospho-CoA kinase
MIKEKMMKVLGITGGIGSGKTLVLNILKENYNAEIIEADRLGHELMEPGRAVYNNVVSYFGRDILGKDDTIDRKKLGDIVFHDKDKLALLNSISHPLVKEEIVRRIEEQKDAGKKLFVIEAALLIQDGYKSICDKMCYVYADLDVRISRLCEYRGFTQERAQAVIDSQESEAFYLEACDYKIDNSGSLENTKKDLKHILDECRI